MNFFDIFLIHVLLYKSIAYYKIHIRHDKLNVEMPKIPW